MPYTPTYYTLTLADGSAHTVELDPDTQTEVWCDAKLSERHSIDCGDEIIWYATPITALLIEQGTLSIKPA